ncbi:WD40 repeat domain-containing protein [Nocardia sp. NPDC057272]|uniref:WD40 repeat domain-containing protein n=1 Tax=Nocardia sp. NPDC057272 TaxID=3346079 RepID=UPI003624EF0B
MDESEFFRVVLDAELAHGVGRVATSHDGQWIFAGTLWSVGIGNGAVLGLSVIDAAVGRPAWTLPGLACFDAVFAPDGATVAVSTQGPDSQLRISLLRSATGEQIWTIGGGGFLEFGPDGTHLGVVGVRDQGAGESAHVFVLDAATGALRYELQSALSRPRFRRDSTLLCTGCPSLVDARTGAPRWELGDHQNIPSAAVFTNDGDAVLVASAGWAEIVTYEFQTDADGAPIQRGAIDVPELANANLWFDTLVFGPDRTTLVRVGNQDVAVLAVVDGSVRRRLPTPSNGLPFASEFLSGGAQLVVNVAVPPVPQGAGISVVEAHGEAVVWSDPGRDVAHLAVTGDGARVIAGGETSVRVYELGTPARSRRDCQARIAAVAASDGAAAIVAAAAESRLVVFRATSGELMLERVHPGPIGAVAVSPDGHSVVTGSSDGRLRHFDTLTGARWTARHNGPVNAVTFSDNGTRVASASADRNARLFDRVPGADPENVVALWTRLHPLAVTHIAIGPGGAWVATAALDRKVRILSTATGEELHPPFEHDAKIRALRVGDGMVVTASDDGSTVAIDAMTGQRRWRIEHPGPVAVLALSADGGLLATAGTAHTVDIWRIEGDQRVLVQRIPARAAVNDLVFATSGELVVSVDDSVVAVVDPVTGREIDRFLHPMPMSHLASGGDRRIIVGACTDDVARVYDVGER